MRNFKDTMEYVYINSGTHGDYVQEFDSCDAELFDFIRMIDDAASSTVFMGVEFAFEKTREDVCIQLCNILIETTCSVPLHGNCICDSYCHEIKKSLITKAKKEFNRIKKEGFKK